MGHAIPKLEWKNALMTADTENGSDILSNLGDIASVYVGMNVEGSGIPVGTTVIAKPGNTVQISAPATADATVNLDFAFRIEFDYPPIEETGESLDPNETQNVSLSGKRQTSVNFVEGKRNLVFSFLSQTIFDQLKNFYNTYAYAGQEFRYYDDKLTVDFLEYELADLKFNPKKLMPKGTNYIWEVPLKLRRVVY